MKWRRSNIHEEENGIIVITDEEPAPTGFRWFWHWIGELIFWLLAVAPGFLFIIAGASGVLNEQLPVGKIVIRRLAHGQEAVGLGWIQVALGLWALGLGLHWKTGRMLFKVLFNLLAVAALCLGGWFLITSFGERNGLQ